MIRLLVRTLIYFGSAAIAILITSTVLEDFTVQTDGFIIAVVVYALVQTIMGPFIIRLAAKNATAFLGGTGLIASFVALLVATAFGNSLSISGVATWIAATVLVWLITAVMTMVLPLVLVKMGLEQARTEPAVKKGL